MNVFSRRWLPSFVLIAGLTPGLGAAQHAPDASQAAFSQSIDIGKAQPGASIYEAATQSYRLSGGGDDVWGAADDFRFAYTPMSGDVTIAADILLTQPSTHAKAKGMLMIRQSLDPGSPYVDVALHGDGHVDLQWRATQGGETKDVDVPSTGAVRVRLVRRGDRFTAYVLTGLLETPNAPAISVPMQNPVYVGLGVCSHNTGALQTATFSHLEISHGERKVHALQTSDQ